MTHLHLSVTLFLGVSLIVLTAFGGQCFFLLAKNTTDPQARRLRRLLAASWAGLVVVELHGMAFDVLNALAVNQAIILWNAELNIAWDLFLLFENVVNLLLLRELRHGGLDRLIGVFRRVDQLKRAASLDSLTGLRNRTSLTWLKDHPTWQSASLLMVDVDDFKRFNDTYGHQFGDHVLVLVGQAIHRAVREADLVFRYGGEEFLVVCPDAPLDKGSAVGERIRQAMADLPVPATVSLGVAFCPDPRRFDEAVAEADRALYAAKRAGKNRVTAGAAAGQTV